MSFATIDAERRLPYAPADLCTLVTDVRAYPTFIPWMKSLSIMQEKTENGVWNAVAQAVVGWRSITERFTSRIRSTPSKGEVDVTLVDGPLRKLENRWRFTPDGAGGSVVKFHLAYEFKNPLLQALVKVNKDLAAARIMEAFEKEARRRFGASSPSV